MTLLAAHRKLAGLLLAAWSIAPAWSVDIRTLHQQGQYAAAAKAGLSILLSEPWNHELRFLVADSLERSGDAASAQSQFQTLVGTSFAEPAQIRLNNLLTATGKAAGTSGRLLLAANEADFKTSERPVRALPPTANEPAPPRSQSLLRDEVRLAARPPEVEAVFQLNSDGNYRAAARQGKHLINRGLADDDLRLIVANSLAWTGQLDEAIPAYQSIIRTSTSPAKVNDARAGLGNTLRWQGRDDLAVPLYRQALSDNPRHEAAQEGMIYAERELRPKTTITLGRSDDSSHMERHSLSINHRWRDASQQHGFELEFSGNKDRMSETEASQRELTFRYQSLSTTLKPRVWLSAQTAPDAGFFGGAQVQLIPQKLTMQVDRLNWGIYATNTRALLRGLTATHAGLNGKAGFDFGDFNAAVDYYEISDQNNILTTNFRYTAPWRWQGLKAYLGAENREVKFYTPDYWSPSTGYGSAYFGVQGDWSRETWELFTALQAGRRIYGEAGTSWSISAGGRLWINRSVALGLRLWEMSSWRDNAQYRANAATVSLESLW